MAGRRPLGRLVREEDYRRVYREGTRRATALLVVHALPNSLGEVRLGFAVGRRVGRAVARNQLRRRLREIVRGIAPRTRGGVDLVLTPRAAAGRVSFAALREGVAAALDAGHLLTGNAGGGAA